MTDVYDIYKEVLATVNKEENGYLPADLFNTYARAANRDIFNEYNARLQNMQTAAVEKLKIEDRLAPFEMMASLQATGGIFTMPADSAYFRAAKIMADGGATSIKAMALNAQLCEAENDPTINAALIKKQLDELSQSAGFTAVDLLDHDQTSKRINSYVPGKKPSLKKPIMERVTAGKVRGFQVYPSDNLSVFYYYYRRPALTQLVMTPDPRTKELVYDLAASEGFDWEEEAMTDVVNNIVTAFAKYIREGGLFQMAQASLKP